MFRRMLTFSAAAAAWVATAEVWRPFFESTDEVELARTEINAWGRKWLRLVWRWFWIRHLNAHLKKDAQNVYLSRVIYRRFLLNDANMIYSFPIHMKSFRCLFQDSLEETILKISPHLVSYYPRLSIRKGSEKSSKGCCYEWFLTRLLTTRPTEKSITYRERKKAYLLFLSIKYAVFLRVVFWEVGFWQTSNCLEMS